MHKGCDSPISRRATARELVHDPLALLLALALGFVVALPLLAFVHDLLAPAPATRLFTEDAYYSLSIARSLAHWHGFSPDAQQLTTGAQPLWPIVLTPFFWLPGDRLPLIGVGAFSALLWLGTAWEFAQCLATFVVSSTFRHRQRVVLLFLLVFCVQTPLRLQYFNGLETGLFAFLLVMSIRRVLLQRSAPLSPVATGVLLGLLALTRIEGIVLAAAILAGRAVASRQSLRSRSIAVPGAIAAGFLAPWLAYVFAIAHSLLPQSGTATSAAVWPFSDPLVTRAHDTVHDVAAMVVWPRPPGGMTGVGLLALAGAVLVIEYAVLRHTHPLVHRRELAGIGVLVLALGALAGAYTVQSAATWFYPRYLVGAQVLLLGMAGLALVRLVTLLTQDARTTWTVAVLPLALAAWFFVAEPRRDQGHDYMALEVHSLASHPTDSTCRVGMVESGRTGFSDPRVVNLDGKMSVAALRAFLDHRWLDYWNEAGVDVVYVRPFLITAYLDRQYPQWRQEFTTVPDQQVGNEVYLVRPGTACGTAILLATGRQDEHA
jgi:hypothetical protein